MNIKEVSEKFSISPDTLRYWEKVGAIPSVNRNKSGYRDYTIQDLDWISWTNCMRRAGVSVDNIVKYIKLFMEGDHTIPDRKKILQEQLVLIELKKNELQDTYDYLNKKISNYEQKVLKYEQRLKDKSD